MSKIETNLDELNIVSFDTYFSKMDVSEKQRKARIDLANIFLDVFLFEFAFADKVRDRAQIEAKLKEEFVAALPKKYKENGTITDPYMIAYLATIVPSVARTTYQDIIYSNSWGLSYERAVDLAANEATTVENYGDYLDAKADGFTQKTWLAQLDERTRIDHLIMDGRTVGIDEYFIFPDCQMLFAHDVVNGSSRQVANCRCVTIYK